MMSTIHVYCVQPIDDFHLWARPSDVFSETRSDGLLAFEEFNQFFEIAKVAARQISWEGDIIEGPFISIVPPDSGGGSLFIVAWKQGNNGTCFVASPYRLPFLTLTHDNVVGCYLNQKSKGFKLLMKLEKANPLGIL